MWSLPGTSAFLGYDVKVGVTTDDGSLKFVTLEELQPYHWTRAYPPDELEHFEKLKLTKLKM
ncbi:hypothetical protein [Treponema bryantii]|uniref:hypothetical protein n=1 Tax=Treponema bryantii TaxID=163 RepID=UPI0030C7C4C8